MKGHRTHQLRRLALSGARFSFRPLPPRLIVVVMAKITKMKNNNGLPIVIRLLGALGGFFGGGIIGTISLILFMVITDESFGLKNIWSGVLGSAVLGACLGFIFPRIGKKLADIMNYFP